MLNVDGTMLSTMIVSLGTAAGGYMGGRMAGRSSASQIASETVDMLQTQVDVLKGDKEDKDLVVLDLQTRIDAVNAEHTEVLEAIDAAKNWEELEKLRQAGNAR